MHFARAVPVVPTSFSDAMVAGIFAEGGAALVLSRVGKANCPDDLRFCGSWGDIPIADQRIFCGFAIWARRLNQPQMLTRLGDVQMTQWVTPCLDGLRILEDELGKRPLDVETT